MRRFAIIAVLAAAACGGDDGEPISGTITISVGGDAIAPTVGAAIEDADSPGSALVILGTRDINCGTDLESALKAGTYLSFSLEPTEGAQQVFMSVIRVTGGSFHLNGSSGDVNVDGFADRITGDLTFSTTDDDDGEITASGTFDVLRCF